MKALAIRQPLAWLVVNGYKDIENRTWATKYRGPLLIHACKKLADNTGEIVDYCDAHDIPIPDEVDCGGIVGVVEISDCVTKSDSPWFNGPYGFVLTNARPLPTHELKGRLGLFETGLELDAVTPDVL